MALNVNSFQSRRIIITSSLPNRSQQNTNGDIYRASNAAWLQPLLCIIHQLYSSYSLSILSNCHDSDINVVKLAQALQYDLVDITEYVARPFVIVAVRTPYRTILHDSFVVQLRGLSVSTLTPTALQSPNYTLQREQFREAQATSRGE